MRLILAGLVLCGLFAAAPAVAGTPYAVEMKCPVGGAKFTHTATASYSTWGARPDGKPYGSWTFPMPLPVCPNGLVAYREFSKGEIKTLTTYIASPEYRTWAGLDSPYYRAWQLERHLVPSNTAAGFLLQASWETDGQPELKARYQREFVDLVRQQKIGSTPESIVLGLRAANALRELGQFSDAATMANTVRDAAVASSHKEKAGWLDYISSLDKVIERRDPSSEPIDMVGAREASRICMTPTPANATLCDAPNIQKEVARQREIEKSFAPKP